MIGYDDEALSAMMEAYRAQEGKEPAAKDVFNLAMSYDVAYMSQAGILKDGDFTDTYYDEDDAFDFIIDRIAKAREDLDGDTLSELVEIYFDLHDQFMADKGLLSWE